MNKIDRDMLVLMVMMVGVGVIIGLLLRGGGSKRDDHSRQEDRRRTSTNLVFGNIVVGSNNAPGSHMDFGNEDSGDND